VQRFRDRLGFKAHRLCVSLNSRLESNKEEEELTHACKVDAAVPGAVSRVRAKREHLGRLKGLSPESQGQNMALTVLFVPNSLDSGVLGRRVSSKRFHRVILQNNFLRAFMFKDFRYTHFVPPPVFEAPKERNGSNTKPNMT